MEAKEFERFLRSELSHFHNSLCAGYQQAVCKSRLAAGPKLYAQAPSTRPSGTASSLTLGPSHFPSANVALEDWSPAPGTEADANYLSSSSEVRPRCGSDDARSRKNGERLCVPPMQGTVFSPPSSEVEAPLPPPRMSENGISFLAAAQLGKPAKSAPTEEAVQQIPNDVELNGVMSHDVRKREGDAASQSSSWQLSVPPTDNPPLTPCGTPRTPRPEASPWRSNSNQGAEMLRFELDSIWQDELVAEMSSSRMLGVQRSQSFGESKSQMSVRSLGTDADCRPPDANEVERFVRERLNCLNRWVVHPNAKKRLAWDFFGMACIGYDMVMIPLQIFNFHEQWWMEAMALLTSMFWTLDVPSSFFVGFHDRGIIELKFVRCARRYMLSWFVVDLVLVVSDWIDLYTDGIAQQEAMESVGLARLGKSLRVLRVVRLFRLLRLIKLPKYLLHLEEHISSEYANIGIGILKQIICILVLNHFVACLWYGIGTDFDPSTLKPNSWVSAHKIEGASMEYAYATSMHWSLTQFTPASMEVHPANVQERAFTIVVLIFAMVTFSSFVSSITNAMTALRNINSEYAKQLVIFQRYLRYNNVSTALSVRMRRHLEHQVFREGRAIEEKDVQLVKALSDPLRIELHLEVYAPLLESHTFFHFYSQMNHAAMRKLCHTAVIEIALSQGDTLFSAGEACENMMFMQSGRLHYFPASSLGFMTSESADSERKSRPSHERAHRGDWLCEACLWVPWVHIGDAVAYSRCAFLGVSRGKFHMVARNCRGMQLRPSRYAELFVRFLNALEEFELTDLAFPEFDAHHATLVASGRAV